MFSSSRDEAIRRRNRISNNNKAARSSKTSLLSTTSVSTTESAGSNTTVTQESYNRSHKSRRRRTHQHREPREDREHREDRENREHREHREHRLRRTKYENPNRSFHVFDFLVDENSKSRESLYAGKDAKVIKKPDPESLENTIEEDVEQSDDEEAEPNIDESLDNDVVGDIEEESEEEPEEEPEDEPEDEPEEEDVVEETPNGCIKLVAEDDHDDEDADDIEDEPVQVTVESTTVIIQDSLDSDSDESSEDEGTPTESEIVIHEDEHEPEGFYRHMSDSGISMNSRSSSVSGSPPKPSLSTLHDELPHQMTSRQQPNNEMTLFDPRFRWSTLSPQPYPEVFIPPPCPVPPPAAVYDVPAYPPYSYPHPPYTPYGTPPPTPEEEIRGPSITIREPSGQKIRPRCFRDFSKLATRVLLHKQDDLADLQEELDDLDKDLDTIEQMSIRDSSPARSERRELKIREEELYQEAQIKLEEYYQYLEITNKVQEMSRSAVTSDLTKHHQWLTARILEKDRIRRLVGSDLRTFAPPCSTPSPTSPHSPPTPSVSASPSSSSILETSVSSSSTTMTTTTVNEAVNVQIPRTFQPQYLAYAALTNAVVPLMSFKVITSVLNRLIFLSIVVVIGSIVQDRMRIKIGKDELTCTLLSISISAFAAIFL